jgi:hypothetical protein
MLIQTCISRPSRRRDTDELDRQASQLHKYVEDHGWTVVDDAEKTVAVLTAGSSSRLPAARQQRQARKNQRKAAKAVRRNNR